MEEPHVPTPEQYEAYRVVQKYHSYLGNKKLSERSDEKKEKHRKVLSENLKKARAARKVKQKSLTK